MLHNTVLHDTLLHDTLLHDTLLHDTLLHPSFRQGFEKAANDASTVVPTSPTAFKPTWKSWHADRVYKNPASTFSKAKTFGSDFLSGMGIGKGIMPKAFGAMTALDIFGKTTGMMNRPRTLTGIKL